MQFVINYEEGGENCVLHGDGASEALLSEIVGASAYSGARHVNMESLCVWVWAASVTGPAPSAADTLPARS